MGPGSGAVVLVQTIHSWPFTPPTRRPITSKDSALKLYKTLPSFVSDSHK